VKRQPAGFFRGSALGCLLGVALTLGSLVWAQAADATGVTAARANVRVRVVGMLGRDDVLKQRIASWFEPARFAVRVESVSYLEPQQVLSPEHGLLVEAWVTLRSDKLARLYFASPDPDTGKTRYLLRDLALESGLDEMGSEALAGAVHLSTVALLEGQLTSSREQVEQSLQSEAAPASDARPAATATPASEARRIPRAAAAPTSEDTTSRPRVARNGAKAWKLDAALGYAAQFRGDEGFAHGPRARLRVGFPAAWGALARLQVVLPHQRELKDLSLELYGGAVLVAASLRGQVSPHFVVEGFAGPSLELVRYTARARSDVAFEPAPAATELRPQLVFGAFFGIGTAPRFALIPELAIALHATSYEMARAGQRESVARGARLTPSLALELEL
jgi:hypothetical protein